jgi:imidazole glycerol-phosphate synthase subunit HisF
MRIIPRLDIKNNFVIKGINLEGLRKVGEPNQLGIKYYNEEADEIIFMDAVASYYGRNNLFDIIKKCTKDIFIPITIGGGLRTLNDISLALNSGADKVALNSAAVKNPKFILDASKTFGSSTIIMSIETKKNKENMWEIFTGTGREPSGINLKNWIDQIQENGCGEILITSIDQEGTQNGFDLELLEYLKRLDIEVPVIFSGGCGNLEDIKKIKKSLEDDAIALASVLHYEKLKITDIKKEIYSE